MTQELQAELHQGVLVRFFGGFYVAADADGQEYTLRCPKKFRHQRLSPLVGDAVRFTPGQGEEEGWLVEILPRKTECIRPPVANVTLLLVSICPSPEPDLLLVDRLLARAKKQGMKTALIVGKCDLDGGKLLAQMQEEYRGADCPVLGVSARNKEGLDSVRALMRGEDCCCLAGQSGVGKSTLFKCIVGEEKPDCGTIRFGAGVDIGYYDQHQAQLHENKTVLDEVWDDFHRLDQTEVRGALGLFLFTGDDVLMPISTLSGGEKGRVALTKLMLKKDNVLLLDEPTNHLDMDSREVLEDALENFPGTILAISHDRYFINRFATKVCVLEAGGVKEYLGNYDDYFEKINRQQAPDSENAGMTKTAMDKEKRKSREEEKRIREKKNAIAAAEKAIATAEEEAAEMEAQLADPATYQDAEKAAQLAKAYQLKKDEIERRYAEWEELSAEE